MNETQIAVALKYKGDGNAPLIGAKGRNNLAEKMISVARENNIPVVEDEIMANMLSVQDIGECIPVETWTGVAKIFAFIQKMEKDYGKNV